MIPHTVPKRPMNGRYVAVVASQFMLRSSRVDFFADAELQRALERNFVGDGTARLHLAVYLGVSEVEYGDQGRDAELLARDRDRIHTRSLSGKRARMRVSAASIAEARPFRKDDRP